MSGALRENDDAAAVEDPHIAACIWDCETVLSNYSNIDNHPGLLSEPSSRCVPSSPVNVCLPIYHLRDGSMMLRSSQSCVLQGQPQQAQQAGAG